MLKIRAIRLEINTSDGLFGADYRFNNGLNIVRGDNSSGKSSLFQSILYGLGFEELLGGKNEKTMQSVLRDQVEYPKSQFHSVIQSFVYLEIENTQVVTVKRSVVSETRKPQLVDVYNGAFITGVSQSLVSRPMYIHDKGGATDDVFGFHMFLAEFLGWKLPEIITTKGEVSHLYLQQIASAFILEQKTGWSDFFATLPYYAMRNTESRIVEFLLDLDVYENQKRKHQLQSDRQKLSNKWENIFGSLSKLAERSGGTLRGIEPSPSVINSFGAIYISILNDDKEISINEFNDYQKQELARLESQQTDTVGDNVKKNEELLNKLTRRLSQLSLNYEMLSPEVNYDSEKISELYKQLDAVGEDLRKNKGALKVKSLGHQLPAETASDVCPTCHQEIKDSLLPSEIQQTPMRIEENVLFLEAQKRMIEVYIEGQESVIEEKRWKLNSYQNQLSNLRQEIRQTKKELVRDERLPSVLQIEERINLQKKVEFFGRLIEEFSQAIDRVKELSKELEGIYAQEKEMSKDFLSAVDHRKLEALEASFLSFLSRFNYQSKPFGAIRISRENYLPLAQKMVGEQLFYNIKFDSSASDFIRCLWSYYTSLLKTSIEFSGNHPRLLIFDEPKQQDVSMDNFHTFLKELSEFKDQQILVFASFENLNESFLEATRDLEFSLIEIVDKLIKPIRLA